MFPPTSSRSSGRRLALLGGAALGAAALRTVAVVTARRRAGRAWRELHHDTVLPGPPPTLRLAVLGDSAVAGHGLTEADAALPRQLGARLARRTGRGVEITSLASSGADTAGVTTEQVPAIGSADVVVIGVGVNDALRPMRRMGEIDRDTSRLLAAVHARAPAADMVLLTCPDLSSAPGVPRALAPVVGWRCRAAAAAQIRAAAAAGVGVVPTSGRLPAAVFGDDGFHPGSRALQHLADRTVEVLLGEDDGAGSA